jgi:hypothetical protein
MQCTVGSAMNMAAQGAPRQALHLFALARANELHLLAERSTAPIVRTAPQSRPHWLSRLLRSISRV